MRVLRRYLIKAASRNMAWHAVSYIGCPQDPCNKAQHAHANPRPQGSGLDLPGNRVRSTSAKNRNEAKPYSKAETRPTDGGQEDGERSAHV